MGRRCDHRKTKQQIWEKLKVLIVFALTTWKQRQRQHICDQTIISGEAAFSLPGHCAAVGSFTTHSNLNRCTWGTGYFLTLWDFRQSSVGRNLFIHRLLSRWSSKGSPADAEHHDCSCERKNNFHEKGIVAMHTLFSNRVTAWLGTNQRNAKKAVTETKVRAILGSQTIKSQEQKPR